MRVRAALATRAPWIAAADVLAHLGVAHRGDAYWLAAATLRRDEGRIASDAEIEARGAGAALALSPAGYWKLAFLTLTTINEMIEQTEAQQAALAECAEAVRAAVAQGRPPPLH